MGPVDLIRERYPALELDSPRGRALLDELRQGLAELGAGILPGFVQSRAVLEAREHPRNPFFDPDRS